MGGDPGPGFGGPLWLEQCGADGPPPAGRGRFVLPSSRVVMSLSGLLSPLSDDPALTRALSLPPGPPGPPGSLPGADLVGPPALRPVLAAALTGAGLAGPADGTVADGPPGGRFVLAVTATAR